MTDVFYCESCDLYEYTDIPSHFLPALLAGMPIKLLYFIFHRLNKNESFKCKAINQKGVPWYLVWFNTLTWSCDILWIVMAH